MIRRVFRLTGSLVLEMDGVEITLAYLYDWSVCFFRNE